MDPPKAKRLFLLTLCLAVLIVQIDTSVVNLAVHAIGVAFHAPVDILQWTVDGYNMTYALLLLSGGTLADIFGRRRIFRYGVWLFTAGSVICGLAPGAAILVLGRVLAGVGAALLTSSSLALIRVIWPDPHSRAHAIGIWAGTNGAAFAIGPTVGGYLISYAGWRSIFLLVIPVGLLSIWLARRLPESADSAGRRLDLPGQLLAGMALLGITVGLIESGNIAHWGIALGTLSLIGFSLVEWKSGAAAMVPMALLANKKLIGPLGIAAAMTFGMYGLIFLLPLVWLHSGVMDVRGAGIALLPASLSFFALSHKAGAWSHRFGVYPLMVAGMSLIGAGIAIFSFTNGGQPVWLAEICLLLTGIGMALNTGPALAAAMSSVDASRAGTASALINTARMIGATLGVAVAGSIFNTAGTVGPGFNWAMEAGAAVVMCGALLALLMHRSLVRDGAA